MNLETLARRHVDEVRAAVADAAIPSLFEKRGGRPNRRLRAALAGAAAALAAIVVVVVTTRGDDTVSPTTIPPIATTTSVPAPSVADLESAVSESIAAITAGPGVEGVQRGFVQDYLGSSIRFKSDLAGKSFVVQQLDRDIVDTGWWLADGSTPPGVNERLSITVFVDIDGRLYEATLDDPDSRWAAREGSPGGPALALALLELEDPFRLGSVDPAATVTRSGLVGGGTAWTLTTTIGEGAVLQRWDIRPDGTLTWSAQAIDAFVPADPTNPFTSTLIEWRQLDIEPTIDEPGDSVPEYLATLDLPENVISGEQLSPVVTLPPTTTP